MKPPKPPAVDVPAMTYLMTASGEELLVQVNLLISEAAEERLLQLPPPSVDPDAFVLVRDRISRRRWRLARGGDDEVLAVVVPSEPASGCPSC